MGTAAYKAIIKTAGIETAMVNEPCELLIPNVYRIISPLRRILSRTADVIIMVDGFPLDEDLPAINYLTGVLTFTEDPGGVVTISASYIPTAELVGGFSYQLNITGDILDDTNFKDARVDEFHSKRYGLLDVSASFDAHSDFSKRFVNYKRNRDSVLITIQPGGIEGTGYIGWFVLEKDSLSGDVGALEDESISFNLQGGAQCFAYFEPYLVGLTITGTDIDGADGDYLRNVDINGRASFYRQDGADYYLLYWHEDGYWTFLEPAFVVSSAPHGALPQDVSQWVITDPYSVVPVSITPIYSI
jgi:hypothetical protein